MNAVKTGVILSCLVFLLFLLLAGCENNQPPQEYLERAVCGDGDRQSSEKCDGEDLANKSCEDLGFGPGVLGCKPNCRDFSRADCAAPAGCGDGDTQDAEICDGLDLSGQSCEGLGYGPGTLRCLANCGEYDVSQCAPPPTCNNGKIDKPLEVCDGDNFGSVTCRRLGYTDGHLSCTQSCTVIDPSGCFLASDSGHTNDAGSADSSMSDAAVLSDLGPLRPDNILPDNFLPDNVLPDNPWRPDVVTLPDAVAAMDAGRVDSGNPGVCTLNDIFYDSANACNPGFFCSVRESVATCVPAEQANGGTLYGVCGADGECPVGSLCAGPSVADSLCRPLCSVDHSNCPEGGDCIYALQGYPGVKMCGVDDNCNPMDNTGCESGGCYITGTDSTLCLGLPGASTLGQHCDYVDDCAPQLLCITNACKKVCTLSGDDCGAAETCLDVGVTDYGICD